MIDLSALAAAAAAQGVPKAERLMAAGISGDVAIDFEVSADGSVRMLTPGWEPVIEGTVITEFRPVPVDPFTLADQGYIAMIEMLRNLTRSGAALEEAAALTVAFIRAAGQNQ